MRNCIRMNSGLIKMLNIEKAEKMKKYYNCIHIRHLSTQKKNQNNFFIERKMQICIFDIVLISDAYSKKTTETVI